MDNKPPDKPWWQVNAKTVITIILLVIFVPFFFSLLLPSGGKEVEISQVLAMAQEGQIKTIQVKGDALIVLTAEGKVFKSRKEPDTSILELLRERGVATGKNGVKVQVKGEGFNFGKILVNFLPLIFIIGLILFMMRKAQQNTDLTRGMGASKGKPD